VSRGHEVKVSRTLTLYCTFLPRPFTAVLSVLQSPMLPTVNLKVLLTGHSVYILVMSSEFVNIDFMEIVIGWYLCNDVMYFKIIRSSITLF